MTVSFFLNFNNSLTCFYSQIIVFLNVLSNHAFAFPLHFLFHEEHTSSDIQYIQYGILKKDSDVLIL